MTESKSEADVARYIQRPIFVVGCSRSGTSLLFSLLSAAVEIWSPYRELHGVYEWEIGLHPDYNRDDGNRLTAEQVTPQRSAYVSRGLWQQARNTEMFGVSNLEFGRRRSLASAASMLFKRLWPAPLRIIDKNPKNCFRVEFFKRMFPDAFFVFLFRDGRSNIASIIRAWSAKEFETYKIPLDPTKPDGEKFQWHLDLPPGYRRLVGRPVPEISAAQWVAANEAILAAEQGGGAGCSVRIRYEDLIANPVEQVRQICQAAGIRPGKRMMEMSAKLPPVNSSGTPPAADKWRRLEKEIAAVSEQVSPMMARLGYE